MPPTHVPPSQADPDPQVPVVEGADEDIDMLNEFDSGAEAPFDAGREPDNELVYAFEPDPLTAAMPTPDAGTGCGPPHGPSRPPKIRFYSGLKRKLVAESPAISNGYSSASPSPVGKRRKVLPTQEREAVTPDSLIESGCDENADFESGEEGADYRASGGSISSEDDEGIDSEDNESIDSGDEVGDTNLGDTPPAKSKKSDEVVTKDIYTYGEGIRPGNKIVDNIPDVVSDMVNKMLAQEAGLGGKLPLRVGTACSGTDIPIIALIMAAKELLLLKSQGKTNFELDIDHIFSVEIVPFKQAYLKRNFDTIIFRDVTDFKKDADEDGVSRAMTIYNTKADVPGKLDLLICGFCCVDFSAMNNNKKKLESQGESGDTFFSIKEYARRHSPKIIILENVISAPWKAKEHKEPTAAARKKMAAARVVKIDKAVAAAIKKLEKPEKKKITDKKILNEIREEETKKIDDKAACRENLDAHFKEIGYRSTHVLLDTQDYYLPQIRNRGYLIAIHLGEFAKSMSGEPTSEQIELAVENALGKWRDHMKMFKSPASVTAAAWLVAAEDENQPTVSRVEELEPQDKKAVKWAKCKLQHSKYRDLNGYGEKRELTHWNENGFRKRPEHWVYFKGMTDRVSDVLEIAHLRNIVRGFDDRYYSRYLDLSQNVHREQNKISDGLIGCLTPRGIPFWTYKGRRLTGREALTLQGFPVDHVDLGQLTDSHLQDLTGNAMTSTAVAAAMFSAILAFSRMLIPPSGNNSQGSPINIDVVQPRFETVRGMLQQKTGPAFVDRPMSADQAKCLAARTVCLCHCEGRHEKHDKTFRRCAVCRYTGCAECTGNPIHSFELIEGGELGLRKVPAYFETRLRDAIPTKISFSSLEDVVEKIEKESPQVVPVAWSELKGLYSAAIFSDLCLEKIVRGVTWEVLYQSPQAKLVLTISGAQVMWLLYAAPHPRYDMFHPVRKYFEAHPIARLVSTGNDITQGDWEVFVPKYRLVDAAITYSGQLVPSYENHIGLSEHKGQYVFNKCYVEISTSNRTFFKPDINGHYVAHPKCGQAFASLYVKKSTQDHATPLYFFMDHAGQRGDPREDQFGFTHDTHRQKPTEQRVLIGQITSQAAYSKPPAGKAKGKGKSMSWRPLRVKWDSADVRQENVQYRGSEDLDFKKLPCPLAEFLPSEKVKIATGGFWISSGLSMDVQPKLSISYQHIPADSPSSLINDSCAQPKGVFQCRSEIPEYTARKYPVGEMIRLGPTNQLQAMQDFSWVLKRVLSIPGYRCLDHSQDHDTLGIASQKWYQFPLPQVIRNCQGCAPDRPRLLWAFADNQTHEPYEDPRSAAAWERQYKARPRAIDLDFFIERTEAGVVGHAANFQVNVDFQTLVHKALSELTSSGDLRGVVASISLATDCLVTPRKLCASRFSIPDSRWLLSDGNLEPPREFHEYQLPGALKLRPEQCRSVAWQVIQEITRPKFTEEIITEEQTIFGYRASAMVSRSVEIRGGCLFHPVGFGKTAVVLGLISMQEDSDTKWAREERQKSTGFIPLKATLILMPPQLTKQWKAEVTKFLEPRPDQIILVIEKPGDWDSLSIKDFQKAWIVIVSWALFNELDYFQKSAQWAGMLGIDGDMPPRAYKAFHETILSRIPNNINILRSQPDDFNKLLNQQIKQNLTDVQENDLPVPSRRTRGAAYQEKKKGGDKGKKSTAKFTSFRAPNFKKGPETGGSWESTKCVPLEAFSWARVIADEISYLEDSVITVLRNVQKANLWLLSATPGLDSFEDIRRIALLFGINLGVQDFALLPSDVWKKSTAGMTLSEKSLSYDEPKSSMWYDHRDERAGALLKLISICDLPTYGKIKFQKLIKLSIPPATQMALSRELMQLLAVTFHGSLPTQTTIRKTNQGLHFLAALKDSKTAAQALMKQAGVFQHTADPKFMPLLLKEVSKYKELSATAACRRKSLEASLEAFIAKLPKIFWLLTHQEAGRGLEAWEIFVGCLKNNQWGDELVCHNFLSVISAVRVSGSENFLAHWSSEYPVGATALAYGKINPKAQVDLREAIKDLSIKVGDFCQEARALRFIKAAQSLRLPTPCKFDCPCGETPELDEIIILTGCGHIVCESCIHHQNDKCPTRGCKSGSEVYQRVPAHLFVIPGVRDKASGYGQKATDLVKLIKSFPEDDKVLLFIQHKSMIAQVAEILEVAKISCTILDDKFDEQANLVKFQKNQGGIKVLLLNIDGASASGLNLTCASHVIFYAPFMTTGSSGKEKYEAAIKQAIGRAVRYGQKAECVKVYYLMTAYSIDVDIYEHRKEKIIIQDTLPGTYTVRDRDHGGELTGRFSSCVPWVVHEPSGAYGY